jgi:hypothetical protein
MFYGQNYILRAFIVCVVGIATRCGLDSLRIEFCWERDFLHPSRPALGPTQPPV